MNKKQQQSSKFMRTGSQLAWGGKGGKYLEGKANGTEVDRKLHLLVGETN